MNELLGGPAMTPQTRALIEAAEAINKARKSDPTRRFTGKIWDAFEAAISSAKAVEEGVEIAYKCRSCNMTLTKEGHKNWVGCDVCEGDGLIAMDTVKPLFNGGAHLLGAILDRIDSAPNDDPRTYIREYVAGLQERKHLLEKEGL